MNKEKECLGCGAILQDKDKNQEGYTENLENELCQRCFRMKNYGEYKIVSKSNEEYMEILKQVGNTGDLVLLILDLTSLDENLDDFKPIQKNPTILVLNKRDALPKSINNNKLISYFKERYPFLCDIMVTSSKNNNGMDALYHSIKKHQTSKNVYVVGHTNVGKSSFINKMIQNYSMSSRELTISPLPSTTLNKMEIELDETLTFIDTPGLVSRGNISNYVKPSALKKLQSKKEMKPHTFQIKEGECLIIDEFMRVDYIEGKKNSFTCYTANAITIRKMNAEKQTRMKELEKRTYQIGKKEDLVIEGLGWIKIVDSGKIDIYIDSKIKTFIRKSII